MSRDDAPGPSQVAKLLLERVLEREVSPRHARLLNIATHWGFGLAAGAACGVLIGSRRTRKSGADPRSAPRSAGGYAVLPQLGVYEQIWKHDLETLWKNLSAHLVFGTATAAAYGVLARRESR